MAQRRGYRFLAVVMPRLLAAGCLAGLAVLATPVLAQSAQSNASQPADAGSSTQSSNKALGEVIVRARYVAENIQDTPIPITVQTQAQLKAANITNMDKLGSVVPNLFTMPGDSQAAGTPVIGMRGVMQGVGSSSSLAVPPAIAIYTDGIYHSTTAGSELDFTDVDRIEVNRGPQSTLSGNASIGGSIELHTVDPRGDGSGYLQLEGGSYSLLDVSGALDEGLSDTVAVRVSGHLKRQNGFGNRLDFACEMDKLGTPQLAGTLSGQADAANRNCITGHTGGGKMAVGQIKLRWRPNSNVDLILEGRHREEDMEETPEVALAYTPACFDTPTCTNSAGAQDYNRATFNTFGVMAGDWFVTPARDGGIYDTYGTNCRPNLDLSGGGFPAGYPVDFCYSPEKTARYDLASANLSANLSDKVHMTAIVGYTNYENEFTQDGDASPLGNVISHFVNTDAQWTGEMRFDGKLFDDRLQWVLGGFMLRLTGHQNNMISFVNIYQLSHVTGKNKSQSGFFHLDYNLTDRWRVSGGARYTDGEIAITIDNPQAVSVLAPVSAIQHRVDWLLSTDYKVTDNILAYVSAATGSRPPGLTTIVITPRQLQPTAAESLIEYEAGIKADMFDHRVRTDLTAFYTDYRKLSASARGTECVNQPGPVATWFNVDQSDPEANVVCSQFPGKPYPTAFYYNVGVPATIRGFEWQITAIPIDGLLIDWSGGFNKFKSGVKTPGAPGYLAPGNHRQPQWNMHADASYDIDTPVGTFTPRLDWSWQSQQDYDPTPQVGPPAPLYVIHPYSIWNAQLSYQVPSGNWSAAFQVTNLTDKWYHYQVYTGSVDTYTRVAPPREFKLTVRRQF